MMRHRNGAVAGWRTRRSAAPAQRLTCSSAPVPTSRIGGHWRLRFRARYYAKGDCSMPPEDARFQDVRAWLSKAELDLKAAAHEVSAPAEGLWGDVVFHAQQPAEKTMKAFLA